MAVDTAEVVVRRGLKEPGEHLPDRAGQPEDHGSLADLARGVP